MAKPSAVIQHYFPFEPTSGQKRLFQMLDDFILGEIPCMMLKGFAGTGKTTVISALVKMLPHFNLRSALLAPTGRAAKVMGQYSKRTAFTIHKIIYSQTAEPGSTELSFRRQKNYSKNTVFIIDEVSMLTDEGEFGKVGLLTDLFQFVFSDPSNKILLVGDTAQLPPVGKLNSPALNKNYLTATFKKEVSEIELKEVVRQESESGILANATSLRNLLEKRSQKISFNTAAYPDIFRMTAEKMEDGLRYAYDKFGTENTIIICRSNKNAVQYNQFIRRNIHYTESEIDAGDFIMVVKNNYHFLPADAKAGFLANGDFAEVLKIVRYEELYGLRFADLEIQLTDYPEEQPFEVKVILDTLHNYAPSLPAEDYSKLYQAVREDYYDVTDPKELKQKLKKDPYLNALQIKFAYALTCHKSQGGQWKAVFVDQGYLTDEMVDTEYVRWLYTAVTRATDQLFLVNFNANFF